jgi:hypothetical protein
MENTEVILLRKRNSATELDRVAGTESEQLIVFCPVL